MALIAILLFLILRRIFQRIYAPKTYLVEETRRVRPLPRSLLGWLPALFALPREDLIRTSGLDAYFFARYLYVHALFFIASFILLAIILFPIYAVNGKGSSGGKTGLDLLTFGNIALQHSSRYTAPLILAYLFILSFLGLIYLEMKAFIGKRQALLRSSAYRSHGSATTILVMGIPKVYMSTDVLRSIFNQYPGGIRYLWLNRHFKDLSKKVNERMKFVEKLETIECKLIRGVLKKRKKTPMERRFEQGTFDHFIPKKKRPTIRVGSIRCWGEKVDAINYYKEKISQLNTEIDQLKEMIESYPLSNSAFIQFNEQIAAHMAIQSVASSVPLTMTPRYMNIKPTTIVWSNLNFTYYEKKIRQLLSLAATTTLIVFWAIPVAFVGLLSNITYLTEKFPFLRFIDNLPRSLVGLITGLLPTILLAILMALLPIVLRFLARFSGLPTTDAIDRYVQGSYFVFQVVHVFLVVTISSSVSSVVLAIIQNPPSAATILAANIPTASHFFLSFLALQGLSVASALLLQLSTFLLFHLLGFLFDHTPRKKARRYFTLSSLSWGTVFPIFTNFVVITIVYSIIAPLMLLIAGIAFALFYIAYLYTMFYVSDFPNDSGGLAYSRAIYQSFTGIYLMEILLSGLFFLAQNEQRSPVTIPHGILMCILILITVGGHLTMISTFDPLTFYLPVDANEYAKVESSQLDSIPWSKRINKILRPTMNENIPMDEDEERNREDAYLHPAVKDPSPIIWIPEDRLGMAIDEVRRTSLSGWNLIMSTRGARFNEKNQIEVDGPSPDYTIETRF